MMPDEGKLSFNEFMQIDNKNDSLMEFIDGKIYLQASPNTVHQRISRKLSAIFDNYFLDKQCEPFIAPYDIILISENEKTMNKVIPDISVICDKSGLNDKNYMGVPVLIVEILSPSTAWYDISKKLELYQRYGVKEYWIISPKNNNIQIFNINENGYYDEPVIYYKNNIAESNIFKGLSVNLKDIFTV